MSLRPVVLLAAWTLFVWGLRSRNLTDDSVQVGLGQIVPVVGFIVLGLGLVAILWRNRAWGSKASRAGAGRAASRELLAIEVKFIGAAALVVGVYWLIRGVEIFFDDHSSAFIAVHTVLATVSVGLASWTILTIGNGRGRAAE